MMTLRAYDLRTRRPRNALQGCPAPTKVDSAHSASLNFQFVIPPEDTFFTASSPTPTPSHAVKFGDAPLCKVVVDRAMTLRAFHLRTRSHRSAVQGRLAPTKVVSDAGVSDGGVALIEARHLRDTAYVGARRPCTALLGHCVRKPNARNGYIQRLTQWRVTSLCGAQWRRRRRRCREGCVLWV